MIYLDHAASTYPYVEVLRLYEELLPAEYANPSAAHRLGLAAEKQIKAAKEQVAGLLRCEPSELIVCSGATEAANLAIKGYLRANRHSGSQVLVSAGEHPAVRESAKAIAQELGLELIFMPLDPEGKVSLSAAASLLNSQTALVCAMGVNNETGAVNDLAALRDLMQRLSPQAKLCVDYVQSLAKTRLNLKQPAVDFAIFSGHKIHAPKGIGLLYVKKGLRIEALLHGGGQQNGLRPGTENPLPLLALSAALERGLKHFEEDREKVRQLRKIFVDELADGSFVINSPEDGSPWILNISFPGIRGETLLHALADEEIYVSQASSCHSKAPYSSVLQAMGLSNERMASALRVSFDAAQSPEEIQQAARSCAAWVARLKR